MYNMSNNSKLLIGVVVLSCLMSSVGIGIYYVNDDTNSANPSSNPSLISRRKINDIILSTIKNNVITPKTYMIIKIGNDNIFPEQNIYFSPVSKQGKGFKINGVTDNNFNIVNDKVFYIYEVENNKKMIGTSETETPDTQYLTYINNVLSLSSKNINFQYKLFDIILR